MIYFCLFIELMLVLLKSENIILFSFLSYFGRVFIFGGKFPFFIFLKLASILLKSFNRGIEKQTIMSDNEYDYEEEKGSGGSSSVGNVTVRDYYQESFETMGLSENLLRSIYSYGFERPSDIQKKSIGCILSKKDVIAQSPSGTGKTGAFSIGTIFSFKRLSDE